MYPIVGFCRNGFSLTKFQSDKRSALALLTTN